MTATGPTIPKKPEGAFRILHTADWHLGKSLNDQSRDGEHARFLEWLLRAAREHGVDSILVAGDVFDTANPPQTALGRYYDFVSALHRQGGCSLVVVAGNHDSGAQLEAPKRALMALGVHVVGHLAEEPAERLLWLPSRENPRVAIAMMPFLRDRDLRVGKAGESADEIRAQVAAGIQARYMETAEAFRQSGATCPALATGHLTVVGAKTSDSERDIHIGGLGAVGGEMFPAEFAYVALGHLHRPQAVAGDRARYAGSPIPLSFSEASDPKEARILDISNGGIAQHGLPIPQFRRLARIRTTTAGLAEALEGFHVEAADLRTWVEVVVEDATFDNDLHERVRQLAEGRGFDVLKVLRGSVNTATGMGVGEATDDEAIGALLDNPTNVFEHLMGEHPSLDDRKKQSLRAAFARLVDLDSQRDLEERP